jgi:hypothetical protein
VVSARTKAGWPKAITNAAIKISRFLNIVFGLYKMGLFFAHSGEILHCVRDDEKNR